MVHLLVVQHNVRQPDVFRGHIQLGDASVLGRIPDELVVLPFLRVESGAPVRRALSQKDLVRDCGLWGASGHHIYLRAPARRLWLGSDLSGSANKKVR